MPPSEDKEQVTSDPVAGTTSVRTAERMTGLHVVFLALVAAFAYPPDVFFSLRMVAYGPWENQVTADPPEFGALLGDELKQEFRGGRYKELG